MLRAGGDAVSVSAPPLDAGGRRSRQPAARGRASVGLTWSRFGAPGWTLPLGGALIAATLWRDGADANGFALAAVIVVLVALAAIDLATRRLPNVITVPTALAALGLRAVAEPSHLGDAALYGAGALAVFAVLYVLMRGGFGMGDVKLAGMLGCVLGSAVVPALVIGMIAGGVGAGALIVLGHAGRRSAIAYGPYLALGGAIAILAFRVPALV
jgi:leader peptidase (prepilin peptidase) / N-methyltransferase